MNVFFIWQKHLETFCGKTQDIQAVLGCCLTGSSWPGWPGRSDSGMNLSGPVSEYANTVKQRFGVKTRTAETLLLPSLESGRTRNRDVYSPKKTPQAKNHELTFATHYELTCATLTKLAYLSSPDSLQHSLNNKP